MEGKTHLAKVAAAGSFYCKLCNVSDNNKGTGREGERARESASARMIERWRQEESEIRGANVIHQGCN